MPLPLGRIGASPHPREYRGSINSSISRVLMISGVPLSGWGGVGRGSSDDDVVCASFCSLVAAFLGTDVEFVGVWRVETHLPRQLEARRCRWETAVLGRRVRLRAILSISTRRGDGNNSRFRFQSRDNIMYTTSTHTRVYRFYTIYSRSIPRTFMPRRLAGRLTRVNSPQLLACVGHRPRAYV